MAKQCTQRIHNLVAKAKKFIIMGGANGKIYQRIAKYGDGWYAPTKGTDDLGTTIGGIEEGL